MLRRMQRENMARYADQCRICVEGVKEGVGEGHLMRLVPGTEALFAKSLSVAPTVLIKIPHTASFRVRKHERSVTRVMLCTGI